MLELYEMKYIDHYLYRNKYINTEYEGLEGKCYLVNVQRPRTPKLQQLTK
jgi:hypothetical protein